MHGCLRGAPDYAPGLTPLRGQFRRPASDPWVCYSGGSFIYLSPTDRTDIGSGVLCTKLSDVEVAAKLAYYAAKLLSVLAP